MRHRSWANRVHPIGICLELQHGPAERSYAIGEALRRAGVDIRVCRADAGDVIPASAADLAGLVVMGGGMSAASDDGFPTRHAEIALIADAVQQGIPTLAICLGAQLLAAAGGAAVYPGPDGPEIAWAPVELTDAARSDALFAGLPPVIEVLLWHNDTFDLPAGAVRLAAGQRYQNQAFRLGARAWGIQFHVEVDAGAVDTFIASFGDEAQQCVGGLEALRSPEALAALDLIRAPLLERFAWLVTAPQ